MPFEKKDSTSTSTPRPHLGDLVAEVSNDNESMTVVSAGRLEELKRREAELIELLEALQKEKIKEVKSHPLTIGIGEKVI
jgi:DNA invertase Pin-like site-specific DNA recombinase